jgi:uncharacterized membrane protein (DUF373 family)
MTEPPGPRIAKLLEIAENYIYYGGGLILVVAAAGLLLSAVVETIELAVSGSYTAAVINLLDRVLLALMVAEIIYTVTNIAKKRRLDVQPFLIIGVIAAIRRMLVITAESTTHVDLSDPTFQAALAELALLAVVILLLAVSFRLLPTEDDQAFGPVEDKYNEGVRPEKGT